MSVITLSARSRRRANNTGAGGRSVNPLEIVDCEDDDLTSGLESVEQFEQRDSDSHGVGSWLG